MRILAGDIGGTSARLVLFEVEGERMESLAEASFPSRDYAGLGDIVREFLSSCSSACERACFGIPGPVRNGRSMVTNLPWSLDAVQLAEILGISRVALLNDLEAHAYGVSALRPEDFLVLNEGRPGVTGNAAIIAAGTGLGEAGLFWDGERYRPFASEGGHADFAAHSDLEIDLLKHLRGRFGHVSWERVLSGPGLVNIYRFLRQERPGDEPAWLTEEMRRTDPAAAVSKAGIAGRCPVCSEALDMFVGFYGREAGNLAVKMMATAGVYVGGGIAPKILERLKGKAFMRAFLDKGRMRATLERFPIKIILNDKTARLGAARYVAAGDALVGTK